MLQVIHQDDRNDFDNLKKTLTDEGISFFVFDSTRGEVMILPDFCGSCGNSNFNIPLSPAGSLCDVPYILTCRKIKDIDTNIKLPGGIMIGKGMLNIIAGPCAVESEKQIMDTAGEVKNAGAAILRGGAFKPRSSPYSFQGLGIEGLKLLKTAGTRYSMPIITEVMDHHEISLVAEYADILQVGARNCQNYTLLKKLGKIDKPVLLKRGMMVTIEEFLMCAEYILSGGNMNVILCERGIRTFETETRNTLDISSVPVLKEKTHLPVFVDPSHAAGSWKLVKPLSLASLAAGADGLMIEVHPDPDAALSDGKQSLRPARFKALMDEIRLLAGFLDKKLQGTGAYTEINLTSEPISTSSSSSAK